MNSSSVKDEHVGFVAITSRSHARTETVYRITVLLFSLEAFFVVQVVNVTRGCNFEEGGLTEAQRSCMTCMHG